MLCFTGCNCLKYVPVTIEHHLIHRGSQAAADAVYPHEAKDGVAFKNQQCDY